MKIGIKGSEYKDEFLKDDFRKDKDAYNKAFVELLGKINLTYVGNKEVEKEEIGTIFTEFTEIKMRYINYTFNTVKKRFEMLFKEEYHKMLEDLIKIW